jgi:hypothetical protein
VLREIAQTEFGQRHRRPASSQRSDLDPLPRLVGAVGALAVLRNDSFEIVSADLGEERAASVCDVLSIQHGA